MKKTLYEIVPEITMTDREREMLEKVEMPYNATSRIPYEKARLLVKILDSMPIGKPMTITDIQHSPLFTKVYDDGNTLLLETVQRIAGNMRKLRCFGYVTRTEVADEPITIKVRGREKTVTPKTAYFTRLK